MEQRLRLDKVIRAEKDGYMSLAGQVSDLEMRVKKRDLRIGGPFGRKSEVVSVEQKHFYFIRETRGYDTRL